MTQPEEWRKPVQLAAAKPRRTIRADQFIRRLGDNLGPLLLACDDGESYAVKGLHAGRVVVNDHVVALFGRAMGAPVPEVCLVDVPKELIDLNGDAMDAFRPGLAHGSRWLPACFDAQGSIEKLFQYAYVPQNRDRFARLAILYGLAEATNRQWLYEFEVPHLVHSVDHGHFFLSGEKWNAETFDPGRGTRPDRLIVKGAGVKQAELKVASGLLQGISDVQIAEIVTAPPDEWELAEEHRIEMAFYLATRRDAMLDWIRRRR